MAHFYGKPSIRILAGATSMAKSRCLLAVVTVIWAVILGCTPETEAKKGGDKPKLSPGEVFKKLDKDNDGFVSLEEFVGKPKNEKDKADREKRFQAKDKNGDGKLTKDEFIAPPPKKPGAKKPPEKRN
jgi:hypothetical protein